MKRVLEKNSPVRYQRTYTMHMQQHWNPVHVSDTDLDTTRIVDYPCDECDSNIESDNRPKCHKGKKHKLTSS